MNPRVLSDTVDLIGAIYTFQFLNGVDLCQPGFLITSEPKHHAIITLKTHPGERLLNIDVNNLTVDLKFHQDDRVKLEMYRLADDSDEAPGLGEISFQDLMEKFFDGYMEEEDDTKTSGPKCPEGNTPEPPRVGE